MRHVQTLVIDGEHVEGTAGTDDDGGSAGHRGIGEKSCQGRLSDVVNNLETVRWG